MTLGTEGLPVTGLRGNGEPDEFNRELTDDELDASDSDRSVETPDDETDSDLITIGEPPSGTSTDNDDAEQQQAAPQWAKDLRKEHRRLQRELAAERRKNSVAPQQQAELPESAGAPPTLEACGWDEAEFRKQTAEHVRKEAAIEARKQQRAADVERQKTESQARVTAYRKNANGLRVPDFEEAEDIVANSLSEVQQNIILHGSDNAAVLVYALGKSPEKAAELAKIDDPIRFAFAVAKLEKEVKVTPRKSAKPDPEQIPTRTASLSGGGSTALEAARRSAEKTGDYTEVNRLKRQARQARK